MRDLPLPGTEGTLNRMIVTAVFSGAPLAENGFVARLWEVGKGGP